MTNKFLNALLIVLTVSLVLVGCGGGDKAVDQFSADLNQTVKGLTTTGKIYVKAGNYRMDLDEAGQPLTVIVDEGVGKTTVAAPLEKMYAEFPVTHAASVTNDPFQGLKYLANMGESRPDGTETIDGYECDKFVVFAEGQKSITQWTAHKLNFPIKIIMHGKTEKTIELKNIKEGPVADSLFQLPADYAMFEMPSDKPAEPPLWSGDLAEAPALTPPFDREMQAGEIVRVKTVSGKSLAVKGECLGESECAAYAIPFKGELPLRDIDTYQNFAAPGNICGRRHETPVEADEYVIRVGQGKAKITAKWTPMHEAKLKAGEELRVPLVPDLNLEDVRFVNLTDSESTCSWNYYSEGNLLNEEIQGPKEYRTRTLRTKNETQRSVWKPFGDEVVIRVEKGEMEVKLGQYDPLKFQ